MQQLRTTGVCWLLRVFLTRSSQAWPEVNAHGTVQHVTPCAGPSKAGEAHEGWTLTLLGEACTAPNLPNESILFFRALLSYDIDAENACCAPSFAIQVCSSTCAFQTVVAIAYLY